MRFRKKRNKNEIKIRKIKKLEEAKHRQDLDAMTKMRIKEGLRE
ncbi:MAG: hypothetical protein ACFE9Z_01715 [Promethearchaeota archaeon]